MKALAILTLTAAAVLPAQAATSIGVSIGINAPGQYGRIDINNYPQAVLETRSPVIYLPSQVSIHQQPIYLYVPALQQANWGRYCNSYRACGQPVHFVREDWVRSEYRREHKHGQGARAQGDRGRDDQGHHRGHDKGHGKGQDRHGG